jgi:hypothetical protein
LTMEISREELLMKLGGAHDQSRIAPDPNF